MALPFRVPAMLMTGALVFILNSTSAAARTALGSAPQPDPCGRLSDLNKEYAELQNLIVQDRAMLEQLGFQSNVERFEREAAYYDELMKRHPVADALGGAFYDTALELIKRNLDTLTTAEAAQMAAAANKIPGVGARFASDIKIIAETPAGQARLTKYLAAMEYLGPALNAFKLGTAEDTRAIVEEAVNQIVSTVLTESSLFSAATRATMLPSLLATEIAIVYPLVADVTEGMLHWPSVYRLLELNDSQLTMLNKTSRLMRTHVDRRKEIVNELKTIDAANCDSTKMVRKSADDDPPAAGKKAKSAGPRKGNAVAAGLLLGGAAAAAGVAIAAMMPAIEDSAVTCGAAPTIPMSCLGINRGSSCNAIIQSYSDWCSCMGRHFDTSTGSCR